MDAQEAKSLSLGSLGDLDIIYSLIKSAAGDGNFTCTINTELMTDRQADYLKEQGYSVYYNSPCLWWEVSW